jgi:hydrogenase nickel incorporation protein HypA/HybF
MHELAICQGLMNQLDRIAADNHASHVEKIYLHIGPLSGVEPELLQSAFTLACVNTVAEQAQLIIQSLPVKVYCNRCDSESEVSTNRLVCAQCGNWQTILLSGDELLLQRVELQCDELSLEALQPIEPQTEH